MGEFDLIARYFTPAHYSPDVLLGVGDDAAVLDVPAGHRLVAAVDTVVEGVHFPVGTAAEHIGYRALAVNLSDIAAMGATPRWFTLSLSMPQADAAWLQAFSQGLLKLASWFDVQLVGGDTVKGPLSISVQILGVVEQDGWLTRSGAKPGDQVFVSGLPGEAAGGLRLVQQPSLRRDEASTAQLLKRFYQPSPRVELGKALRKVASACMDVSDGLLTDLRKLCRSSQCGARLQLEQLPASSALLNTFDIATTEQLILNGGDDYELLFTVPHTRLLELQQLMGTGVRCTPIGEVIAGDGVHCQRHGVSVNLPDTGFDHFADTSS